jgi:hypothetical protein
MHVKFTSHCPFKMNTTESLNFVMFVHKILKFSGYNFSTYKISKKGKLIRETSFFDVIRFVMSVILTIYFTLFFDYSVKMDEEVNSKMISRVIDKLIFAGLTGNIPMRISSFCMQRWFYSVMVDFLNLHKMVFKNLMDSI